MFAADSSAPEARVRMPWYRRQRPAPENRRHANPITAQPSQQKLAAAPLRGSNQRNRPSHLTNLRLIED